MKRPPGEREPDRRLFFELCRDPDFDFRELFWELLDDLCELDFDPFESRECDLLLDLSLGLELLPLRPRVRPRGV